MSGCYHNTKTAVNTEPQVEITTTTTPSASDSMTPKSEVKDEETVVQMTSSGFMPSKVEVKAGTSVKFVNDDTYNHWPASGPHPSHTLLPGFDPKMDIKPGESFLFTFDKVGTWPFHDHVRPSSFGTIVVSE